MFAANFTLRETTERDGINQFVRVEWRENERKKTKKMRHYDVNYRPIS